MSPIEPFKRMRASIYDPATGEYEDVDDTPHLPVVLRATATQLEEAVRAGLVPVDALSIASILRHFADRIEHP